MYEDFHRYRCGYFNNQDCWNQRGKVIKPLRIKATDPVTSLYGAFGKYLYDNRIDLSDVEHVMLTGVGAHYIDKPVYGLPTAKADEFLADGLGAQFESKLQRMIVVSMGTGTSLVLCDGSEVRRYWWYWYWWGTLSGLSRLLLQTDNINEIIALANKGDISRINCRLRTYLPVLFLVYQWMQLHHSLPTHRLMPVVKI